MACTDFTNDFYKLVNIRSNSSRSLFSYLEGQTDDEDDEEDDDEDEDEDDDGEDSSMSESQVKPRNSPTPSEAGRAQLTSCSSSETDEHSITHAPKQQQQLVLTEQAVQEQQQEEQDEEEEHDYAVIEECREMALAHKPVLNEQQCIAQIIKTELRRPPHVLVKSKSVLEEQEPSCILRHNQRRELESSVVRSDSISCALMAKMAKDTSISTQHPPSPAVVSKLKERLLQRHEATTTATANSWRRSNGWKRVTSPVQPSALVSPTKKVSENSENSENIEKISLISFLSLQQETKSTSELPKSCHKAPPTRIPTCIHTSSSSSTSSTSSSPSSPSPQTTQQKLPAQQQQPQRKSKIPPPVPVRRSYAS